MSAREQVQRFGGFLAAMVIPNIAGIIAWGLITALFIPTGWLPSAETGRFLRTVAEFARVPADRARSRHCTGSSRRRPSAGPRACPAT